MKNFRETSEFFINSLGSKLGHPVYIYIYMLESYSFVHLLAFRVLLVWPPRRLLVVHLVGGQSSHHKNRVFEDLSDEFWSKLVFLGFLFQKLVTSFLSFFIFLTSQNPCFEKGHFGPKMKKV